MDEVRAEDLVQKIGQPRKDRAVLVAGVDNLTPLGKVTPVTVDDDGNLHVRADKLEEKLEELLGERQQDPAAWSIADRLRRLEEKLALLESGQAKVTLSGSVAQVLDHERAAGFGVRMYYGRSVSARLESAGAVPIVGKTVTIWFHNRSNQSSRLGVKLHWFLGGTVHDGIPEMDFGNVPAGSVLGIRIGGSAPDNAQIIHVPRFGGDGVVFSVDFHSSATGNVRTVILEESSYA